MAREINGSCYAKSSFVFLCFLMSFMCFVVN
jgi:hypothetical protein